ncbi:hypothetical protein ACGFNU_37350 [Spirillospora sp. NPDC048911]|uniref:hypothetical protein n=1 Tax=Spirillospora sp. NPDC048911 TaxID=3364527 RepID=UPI00371B6DE4
MSVRTTRNLLTTLALATAILTTATPAHADPPPIGAEGPAAGAAGIGLLDRLINLKLLLKFLNSEAGLLAKGSNAGANG